MARHAPQARESYRSPEMADLAKAIDHMTLGAGTAAAREKLEAPSFKRILVACDGSPGARQALAWASVLGKRLQAHVTAVSVAPSPEAVRALRTNTMAWQAIGAVFGECEEDAVAVLKRAGDLLAVDDVDYSVELKHGAAAASIVGLAISDRSDLVILGSHGHGLGERLNLGSVGFAVKHHVPCSVLIARTQPPAKHVLLATDGSQRSSVAVRMGLDLAGLFGARITVAHVIDASAYGLSRSKTAPRWKVLASQEHMRESPSLRGLDTRVLYGPPAPKLRQAAKEAKADLIVVGSRGLGGLRSLTLGSVSDKLSHKADQSILVVKPKQS